jgi:hypothetical protein
MRVAFLALLLVAGSAQAQPVDDVKSQPAAASARDEASQRKFDDAAAASQRKLMDEGLARNAAQWKRIGRSSAVFSSRQTRRL